MISPYKSVVSWNQRKVWVGLEGILKIISLQHPTHGQANCPLHQVAQSPIQSGLEDFLC